MGKKCVVILYIEISNTGCNVTRIPTLQIITSFSDHRPIQLYTYTAYSYTVIQADMLQQQERCLARQYLYKNRRVRIYSSTLLYLLYITTPTSTST